MIDYIEKYIDDLEYYQVLFTIITRLVGNKDELEKTIQKAEDENLKIYIDDSDMIEVQWDYITFDMIKMK